MKVIFTILFALIFIFANAQLPKKINGMTLGMHSQDACYDYDSLIIEIKNIGAEWISLVPKFYQQNIFADSLETELFTKQNWQQLQTTVLQAKAKNLKVLLFPIVLLIDSRTNDWRGQMKPNNIELWFENYTKLVTKLAKFAETHQVEMFSVGSELNSLEQNVEHWKKLISSIRKNYSGKITYSVNWDSIAGENFFSSLDLLGISGYFSLTEEIDPPLNDLISAWQKHQIELEQIEILQQVPYYFSEIGYTSLDATNTNPWDRNVSNFYDFEEQKQCLQAFGEVWKDYENFEGVFFYDWFGFGGKKDHTFCIRKKPAAEAVKNYFAD